MVVSIPYLGQIPAKVKSPHFYSLIIKNPRWAKAQMLTWMDKSAPCKTHSGHDKVVVDVSTEAPCPEGFSFQSQRSLSIPRASKKLELAETVSFKSRALRKIWERMPQLHPKNKASSPFLLASDSDWIGRQQRYHNCFLPHCSVKLKIASNGHPVRILSVTHST